MRSAYSYLHIEAFGDKACGDNFVTFDSRAIIEVELLLVAVVPRTGPSVGGMLGLSAAGSCPECGGAGGEGLSFNKFAQRREIRFVFGYLSSSLF